MEQVIQCDSLLGSATTSRVFTVSQVRPEKHMQTNREFELKLALSQDSFDHLTANPALAGHECERSQKILNSVYYDTPDLALHDLGVSLRVRRDGDRFVQTVKAETELENGLSNPVQVETPIDGPEPDIERISDSSLRRRLSKAVSGSVLTDAFKTDVMRTSYKLERGASLVELALDRGEALAKGRKAEIREAELELINGDPKDLLAIAQDLFSGEALHLSQLSKAERGYRLLLEMPEVRPEIAPVKARQANVEEGQTCGAAFAEIVRSASRQIIDNRTVVLETDAPEGAHQLRVGLTRLRAAHRALRRLVDSPAFHQLEDDARAIAHTAGELRDADVLIEDIYAPVAGSVPVEKGFDKFLQALQAHRAAKLELARRCLRGGHWSRLLLTLALWPAMLETDAALQQPIEDYAKKALKKRWKKVAKCGRAIDHLEPAQKHKMRRSLKKLRYMTEFFAPLFPSKEVKPFVKQLKTLQDVFGYVNDVRMAEQLRAIATEGCDWPDCAIAAGVVLGQHEEKAAGTWTHAQGEWRRLKSSDRFWK